MASKFLERLHICSPAIIALNIDHNPCWYLCSDYCTLNNPLDEGIIHIISVYSLGFFELLH